MAELKYSPVRKWIVKYLTEMPLKQGATGGTEVTMRWWHAVVITIGLVIGGALSGGVYSVQVHDLIVFKTNRFTGTVEVAAPRSGIKWERVGVSNQP